MVSILYTSICDERAKRLVLRLLFSICALWVFYRKNSGQDINAAGVPFIYLPYGALYASHDRTTLWRGTDARDYKYSGNWRVEGYFKRGKTDFQVLMLKIFSDDVRNHLLYKWIESK